MSDGGRSTADKIAALLDGASGAPQLVRAYRPDGSAQVAILTTVDSTGAPTTTLPPLPEVHIIEDHDPEELPDDVPDDVAARCEVTIATAHVERAEEDLLVVTRRLPGPPEQQAKARTRLAAAREDLLVKQAALIAEGWEQRR
jgi:hypothetical protein